MSTTVSRLIEQLALQPHPEGGYYKETYRSTEQVPAQALPDRFGGSRHFSTAIYFLLEEGNFSAFHRIRSDELWHFYAGEALLVHVLDTEGKLTTLRLGSNIDEGEQFQAVVPAGCWFAAEPAPGTSYALVGCTVSPGFDFADFELAGVRSLTAAFPQHAALIQRLCREV